MALVTIPRTADLLANLPAYLREDPVVVGVYDAIARELERLRAAARALSDGLLAARADDTYGLLAVHESTVGLPVRPALSEAQRRALVLARLQARSVGTAAQWQAALQTAVGGGVPVTFREGTDQVTVIIPFGAGLRSDQVELLAEDITPAAVELATSFAEGFIVGVSRVGEETI
jgi:Bacteriophage Mu-like, Gp48